jgi:streptogramin lyase
LLWCAGALLVPTAAAVPGDYMYVTQLGIPGVSGADSAHFDEPMGIAVDRTGNVFVVDSGNDRILKFQRISDRKYDLMATWGTPGDGPGQFHVPVGIALDTAGNVYVADHWNYRVQKFAPSGDGRQYSFAGEWGYYGGAIHPGALYLPQGIAIGTDGNVYVCELLADVMKYTPSGGFMARLPTYDPSANADAPILQGMACDSLGHFFVANQSDQFVGKYDNSGTFIVGVGCSIGGTQIVPQGVACDASGETLFVTYISGVLKLAAAAAGGSTGYNVVCSFGGSWGDGYLGLRAWGVAIGTEDPLGDVVWAASADKHIVVKYARDSVGPRTKALAAISVKQRKTAKLRFRIADNISTVAYDVAIKIKKGAKVVKTIRLGLRSCDRAYAESYRCTLPKGTYKYFVYAKDKAGNAQSAMTGKKLVVT